MAEGAYLVSVHTGPIAPLGPQAVPSGFRKHPRLGAVAIGLLGLEGDQQADLSVHGGPEKAVYCYAAASYPRWARSHPAHDWQPGMLGENLTIAGFDETTLCIGDTLAVGAARLQICQPRQPCFKLALSLDDPALVRAMVENGLCGWYCRVLEPGQVRAGDAVWLEARPNPDWSVRRVADLIHAHAPDPAALRALAALPGLAGQWPPRLRRKADHRA